MDPALLEMLADLPLATQRTWMAIALPGLWEQPPAEQEARLRAQLARLDLDPWRARIIAGLLRECRLDQAIPERHAAFRPVVADGVTFLLERLPQERLHDLLVAQWLLPPDSPPGERLIALATGLPTLWKLGQMIARRSGLDPALSRLLRRLEDGIRQTEAAAGRRRVAAGLAAWRDQYEFEIAETMLAEGSVGLVMPLRWRRRGSAEPWQDAVAKLIKPEAARRLPEEMASLDEVARRLQVRQAGYAIGTVDFVALFGEVRDGLARELDLAGEQGHLREAAAFYAGRAPGAVPVVLPFSTPEMTVMTRLPGRKVAPPAASVAPEDLGVDRQEISGRPCPDRARDLFRLLILEPLFDEGEATVFHGDPHAGNILWHESVDGHGRWGLLDWSQTGRLSRPQREALVQLALAVIIEDPRRATVYLQRLARTAAGSPVLAVELVAALMAESGGESAGEVPAGPRRLSWLGRAVELVDGLLRRGVVFPRDLLLFRKALFTLDGVLFDLDPAFDADAELVRFLGGLLLDELPARWLDLATPWWDRPARYRTLLSNLDLSLVWACLGRSAWQHAWRELARAFPPPFLAPSPLAL